MLNDVKIELTPSICFLLVVGLLVACAVQAAPDGRALYNEHCNACHQTEGRGGIGLALKGKKFATISDDYVRRSIRYGRPGRIMPAFGSLSDAQVDAVVGFLRARAGAPSPRYSEARLVGDPSIGKPLYLQQCAKCHGANGQSGGVGTGVTLSRKRDFPVIPAAIANSGFLASAPDAMLQAIIEQGRADGGMPSFRGVLSPSDIRHVVAYVRSLRIERPTSEMPGVQAASIIVESPNDFETTIKRVREAVQGSNFRVFPDRYLEEGVTDEFTYNPRQIRIRFCNFDQLYNLLNIEPRLGIVLPCNITVVEKPSGEVLMIAQNMENIAAWFNNDQLSEVAQSMAETLADILDEASL